MERAVRALLVRLGERTFALNARAVRGVVVPEAVTPVPRGGALLLGLLAVRGGIVPLMDLAALLESAPSGGHSTPTTPSADARAVVVDAGGEAFAFLVDDVVGFGNIAGDAPPHLVLGPPTSLGGHPSEQSVQPLNPERVLEAFSQHVSGR